VICGGENSEGNLRTLLLDHHRIKTKTDVALKAKIARTRKSHLGLKKKRTITRWRKFDGTVVTKPRER
jgi:hypothetical protein